MPSAARCGAMRKCFSDLSGSSFAERASDIFDVEKRLLRNLLGRRREELSQLTSPVVDSGARSYAQRNGQSRSQIRPRFRHRSRRPRQPHRDRRRGHGNSGRRRRRPVSDRCFRRRPGDYRRPSGRGHSAARRRNRRPLSARSRAAANAGRAARNAARSAGRNRRRRANRT